LIGRGFAPALTLVGDNMPLTVPQYLIIKTAAGATAAYLSPEADGLKDTKINRELNGKSTLTFSLPILSGGADVPVLEKERDGKKLWGKVTAHESWVLLGKKYATVSNDPQTPIPPSLAVIVISGGSDLSGGLYSVGSAAHALYAILQSTDWSVGTVDVDGTHDLETEKISVLENINKIREIWGGYLVWDSINKTVSLRSEETWAPYTGYQVRYAKNLKEIIRTSDFDIVTKLYPFGENDLNISSVNSGIIYLTNNTYTTKVLEGIWVDQDITDPQELKDRGTKYLAKVCKPRHNYRTKHVDLRILSSYQHEDFDLGHMVDVIDEELGFNIQARIIGYKYNVFQPWQCEIEVGDPIERIESMLVNSREMVNYLNTIKTSKGQINAYKLVDESIIKQKIASAAVDATKLDTKTVILLGDTWADNSPAAGSVAWNQHKLYYAGVEHVITAGNTGQKYIYWDGISNNYSTSATEPTLADGQFIIAVNNGGLHDTVWDKGYAREFIGSAFIADAAIKTAHIADLAVTDAKIASLTANKITTGHLLAYLVEILGKNGYFHIKGDGLRAYSKEGVLKGHLGWYETLADQTAIFSRTSVAYKQDGTQVAPGVPRYEYVPLTAHVWQDLFDTDQLATKYTKYEEVSGNYTVSAGVLSVTTGAGRSFLIKNNLLLQNCKIIVNSDQAQDAGITFRWQDVNNHYVFVFCDASGVAPNKFAVYKRVGGTYTEIALAYVSWARGTTKQIGVFCKGSLIEVYFDDTLIISVTDTTYSGGSIGLRSGANVTTANRFLDFTVYYAQQGVMVEEGTTNLLTANEASVETDTSGFNTINGATLSRDTTTAWHGTASLKIICDGTTSTQGAFVTISASADTTYSGGMWLKGSGTIRVEFRDDTNAIYPGGQTVSLTGSWQRVLANPITYGAAAGNLILVAWTDSAQAITFWADGLQVEQNGYNRSWQLPVSTRASELLTIPASVLNVDKGTIEFDMLVKPNISIQNLQMAFAVSDADEKNQIRFCKNSYSADWHAKFTDSAGASWQPTVPSSAMTPGVHRVALKWNRLSTTAKVLVDGNDMASTADAPLPSSFASASGGVCFIGRWIGPSFYLNSLISNLRISNIDRDDNDILAEYNTGMPLSYDEYTIMLMSCNSTLQPTVRGFGLWTKNGRFILQDPLAGQGIEAWDGSTLKALIGRLDDGTIGVKIVGGKIYGSTIRSGAEGATTYTELGAEGDDPLTVVENGKTALNIWAFNGGMIQFYDTTVDDMRGQILPYDDAVGYGLRVAGRNNTGSAMPVHIGGSGITITGANITFNDEYLGGNTDVSIFGNLIVDGDLSATGSKTAKQPTDNYGERYLYARESPEVRYIDEGEGKLVNGECKINIDPIFLECIEPNTKNTPWLVHLTPMADIQLYVDEIGENYIFVRSAEAVSARFFWSLSCVRKGFAGIRLEQIEPDEDVLTSNWEDDLEV